MPILRCKKKCNKIKFDIVSALHNSSNDNLLHFLFVLQINKVIKGCNGKWQQMQRELLQFSEPNRFICFRVNIGEKKCQGNQN